MNESPAGPSGPIVLMVDDDAAVLSALGRALRPLSCACVTATGGLEALALLEKHDVAIMICDAAMPGMDGMEVLRLTRERSPQTQRVLLTGLIGADDVPQDAPIDSLILAKPWDDEELRRLVSGALDAA